MFRVILASSARTIDYQKNLKPRATTGKLQVIKGQKATCSTASNNEETLSANIHAYSLLPLTILYFSGTESRVNCKNTNFLKGLTFAIFTTWQSSEKLSR